MKVHLGCGDVLLPQYDLHVDQVRHPNIPKERFRQADLRSAWPFEDSTVDLFYASHLIEHLPDPVHTMNQAWHALKPGGLFDIIVPTTEGSAAWASPTHVSFWNRVTFDSFIKGHSFRERFAASYGIKAAFQIVTENIKEFSLVYPTCQITAEQGQGRPSISRPYKTVFSHLFICLKAVK